MYESPRMEGNEYLHRECVIDTWIGVNLREERWVIMEKKPIIGQRCILMTGVLLCLSDISVVVRRAH